jgi:Ca-activated chloride channel homolog
MTEPTASTAGFASIVALLDQDGNGEFSNKELSDSLPFAQVLGGVAPSPSTYYDEARTAKPGAEPKIAAFPTLEQELAAYNATNPPLPYVPIYPKQGGIVADYPYAILSASWVDPLRRVAAERFLQYILGPTGQEVLGAHGFRDPGRGIAGAPKLASDLGFRADLPQSRPEPSSASVTSMMSDWTGLQRRLNILLVLDVSGSMNDPVPGSQLSRLELLKQTAAAGFRLLPNRASVGLWIFSNDLTPPATDHRELVRFGPVSEVIAGRPRVQHLLGALDTLVADGGTGLYNTTYAAFQEMQTRWEPNTSNIVQLITDGKNESKDGLTRAGLIERLQREYRPDRPTQILGFAVGPEADADVLQEISRVTGGRTFVARDAETAIQTLVLAFSGRLR